MRNSIIFLVIIAFLWSSLTPLPQACAFTGQADRYLDLPQPGVMVNLSTDYEPALIKGLTVHQDNPFLFDFIVDTGKSRLAGDALKKEGDRLIKYFFAALTIPDRDVWVNLSPYEKDRMVPQALGQTAMGLDLLAQDYMLKQLTASLIYPEKKLGKAFWDKVYAQAREEFGTTEVPVDTFNKVWIVADKAAVYEHRQTAFIVSGHLKVMLQEDYLAMQKHAYQPGSTSGPSWGRHDISSKVIRSIILPAIEEEVNKGQNFATLRQIFYSQILAVWFKRHLKETLLSELYADHSTVHGINLQDPSIKAKIYQRYLQAYKKGVFNYIKEDISATLEKQGPRTLRKYFSGGYSVSPAMLTDASAAQAAMAADKISTKVFEFKEILHTGPVLGITVASERGRGNVDLAMSAEEQIKKLLITSDFRELEALIVKWGNDRKTGPNIELEKLLEGKISLYKVGETPTGIPEDTAARLRDRVAQALLKIGVYDHNDVIIRMLDLYNINNRQAYKYHVRISDIFKFFPQALLAKQAGRRIDFKFDDNHDTLGAEPVKKFSGITYVKGNWFDQSGEFYKLWKGLTSKVDSIREAAKAQFMARPTLYNLYGLQDKLYKIRYYSWRQTDKDAQEIINGYLKAGVQGRFSYFERFDEAMSVTASLLRPKNIKTGLLPGKEYGRIKPFVPTHFLGIVNTAGNPAQVSPLGGIDLSALNDGMKVSKDADGGVVITVDPAMIARVRREGIASATPLTLSVKAVASVSELLGL